MKLSTLTITLIFCLVSTTLAYDYVIDSGLVGALTLQDSETLLMTGGGIDSLTLMDYSTATIQGTSALDQGDGGVWYLNLTYGSHLNLSGGEVNHLSLFNGATATLSGGLIVQIHSYQLVAPGPHIEIICRDWNWSESTNILTGTWQDYSTFNVDLYDHAPYDPTIDNIKFTIVPEPFSLLLLSAGGAFLARRRR